MKKVFRGKFGELVFTASNAVGVSFRCRPFSFVFKFNIYTLLTDLCGLRIDLFDIRIQYFILSVVTFYKDKLKFFFGIFNKRPYSAYKEVRSLFSIRYSKGLDPDDNKYKKQLKINLFWFIIINKSKLLEEK